MYYTILLHLIYQIIQLLFAILLYIIYIHTKHAILQRKLVGYHESFTKNVHIIGHPQKS